jgi:acetylglutamate kinase
VLDEAGVTIGRLRARDAARLIRQGTANKGMVAKLAACRTALRGGVGDVLIVNGRDANLSALDSNFEVAAASAYTQVTA